MKGRYVADFFSGVGGVARSARRMGFQAREWEMLNGDCYDLTRPCVLRHIEQDASKQKLLAAMLAPLCGSFSGINRFAHRSHDDPWASQVQHASPYMVESVAAGNRCMRAALRIIRILERHKIPWIMEHPLTSRAWWLPGFAALRRQAHIEFVVLDQCMYGTPWKKATALLCSRIDNLNRISHRCGGRRGTCSQTKKAHITLRGADPISGKNWTAIASPYPAKLNRSLAFALVDSARHRYSLGNYL